MKLRPLLALLILNGILSPTAHAYDLDDNVRIEGFGTLGAYHADDPVAMVRADARQKIGSTNNVQLDADSLLAAQVTVNPNSPIKGVMQFVSKQDYKGSVWPKIEWAYLGWDVNSSLNVKAGRVVAPVFMTSETRNVTFAQIMARPINTVYQINPITNINGGNFKWNTRMGEHEFGLEGMAGNTSVTNSLGKFNAKQAFGVGTRYANGPWTVRAGLMAMKLDVDSPTIAAQLAALKASTACSNCTAVIDSRFGMSSQKVRVQTIGALYDDDTYIFQAEYATRPSDTTLVGHVKGWYAMGGKRINAWTPYVMLGQIKSGESDLGLQAAIPAAATTIQFYNDSNFGLGKVNRKQIGAGVRWDFAPKLALKMQWEQFKVSNPTVSKNVVVDYPISATTPSTFDGKVNTLTLNLDFIY